MHTLWTLENIPALHKNVFPIRSHVYGLCKLRDAHEQVCFQSLAGRHAPYGGTSLVDNDDTRCEI